MSLPYMKLAFKFLMALTAHCYKLQLNFLTKTKSTNSSLSMLQSTSRIQRFTWFQGISKSLQRTKLKCIWWEKSP